MNPRSTCVCIPTYQERESLPRTLAGVLSAVPDAHVLVIDDNSPDGTGELADRLAADDPRVHVLHRPGKGGLGPAYIAGFRWALAEGFDVVAQMDADGSHRPEDLPRLLAALAGADAVLGSRWVPGGAVADWPRSRELLSRTANRYVRAALRLPVGDATGGFRAFRRHALERLDLDAVQSEGYCFQIDMTRQVWTRGLRLVEVPILFVNREFGESKMSSRIIREALVRVTAWSLTTRRPTPAAVRPAATGGERLVHRVAA
ncbi:polyprenol monophosphomannose synthase [Modestobacter sp. VKM Ac-2979]|uniref:polyprenol monophosphomannose synthase n=1 Tax=unclassified Modestobacter TaxID=2643866 RepID=UPI0022AB7CD8|nr:MULTISPECIES: polyprenol monophosphomannose synthase [unclassified Modestobacter]MCZ2811061.1 polyprenol monophosphomannose synthase [Modestobacter sp. VKM Ac-2979]MCZ2840574.1 polyprenol monophosphomannose synthase [Modestobacter sp. VKM Ac-2980]